jgi:paraquat-inducible protein A
MGGTARTDTIMSGIIGLWNSGMWAISAIVFVASISSTAETPGTGWLLLSVRRHRPSPPRTHAALCNLDFIGR